MLWVSVNFLQFVIQQRNMKKHRYISVMGTMGSGKTTAARLIAKELNFTLVEENFGENAFLPRFYNDMKRWAFHSQTFFLMEKITQMLETPKMLAAGAVVQDTPIYQDAFSYAKAQHVLGHMDDAEWKLYQKIYKSFEPYFPRPDCIVFLETSIPAIAERIEKRGRGYEQKIPLAYLELLDMLNHKWLSENKKIPVLTIKTDGLNFVQNKTAQIALVEKITKKLKL
jgi:deoxyadenosine/deoxycytidine kinase